MLAPEPFFEPRGTPFSEYHRIKAIGELGHHVDLVTYPIGRDVPLPNLRIFRSVRPPFVRRVRIGPSVTKILLDGLMLFTILRRGTDDEIRRRAFARGNGPGRGVAVASPAHPPPLRHAFEPAAAVEQFQIQPIFGIAAVVRLGREPDGPRLGRCHHHLPGVARHGRSHGRGRAGAAHRERDGRRC